MIEMDMDGGDSAKAAVSSRAVLLRDRGASAKTPVSLEWRNLCYSVTSDKESRAILNNANGFVDGGELCAILGPTGSGKTTLLSALAGRVVHQNHASLTGDIQFNGDSRIVDSVATTTAFVEQDDLLFSMQTVRETLETAARLKMPRDTTDKQRTDTVDGILAELNLQKCANTRVGSTLRRGISGGERKRVVSLHFSLSKT